MKLRRFYFFSLFLTLASFGLGSQQASARALQCQDLPILFKAYLSSHYMFSKMTDTLREHTVDQFVKMLDPSKTTLLSQDVSKLKKDVAGVFDSVQSGNCSPLFESHKLLVSRTKENNELAKKILGDAYKLDESAELILDPQKRQYSTSPAEKATLLTKMIHFQVSNYLLTDMSLDEAKKQLKHRYELAEKRTAERKPEDLLVDYVESFAQSLDPHSSFFSQDSLEEFQIQMRLSLEGIGAALSSQDGYTIFEEIFPGGGADKTKLLRPKDKIIAVAQEGAKAVNTIDMELKDVVKMIRGKKNTKVTLTVLRQAEKMERFDVVIVRDKIDLKEQAAKISYEEKKLGEKNYKIGVIDLPSFYGGGSKAERSSYLDLKALLQEAKTKKVDGIVLDLSRNGGGLLDEAVRISGLFIKKGGVVATKDTRKHVEVLEDEDPEVDYAGPMVVLTSRLSASASEILAGALKDYHRALIVGGDHTFGKGTVQVLAPLPQEIGAMKVTTGMFFLPGGVSTQHGGVPSDIRLPSIFNDEVGETALDYSLPPQTIPSFVSKDANSNELLQHWKPVESAWVKQLASESHQRVSKDPKFEKIEKEIEKSAKNKGVIRLADIRKESEAEKKASKEKLAKADGKGTDKAKVEKKIGDKEKDADAKKTKEMESAFVRESVNILADLIHAEAT